MIQFRRRESVHGMAIIAFTRSLPVIFILSLLLARVRSDGTKGRPAAAADDDKDGEYNILRVVRRSCLHTRVV